MIYFLIFKSHLTISRRTSQTMKKIVTYSPENTVYRSPIQWALMHPHTITEAVFGWSFSSSARIIQRLFLQAEMWTREHVSFLYPIFPFFSLFGCQLYPIYSNQSCSLESPHTTPFSSSASGFNDPQSNMPSPSCIDSKAPGGIVECGDPPCRVPPPSLGEKRQLCLSHESQPNSALAGPGIEPRSSVCNCKCNWCMHQSPLPLLSENMFPFHCSLRFHLRWLQAQKKTFRNAFVFA